MRAAKCERIGCARMTTDGFCYQHNPNRTMLSAAATDALALNKLSRTQAHQRGFRRGYAAGAGAQRERDAKICDDRHVISPLDSQAVFANSLIDDCIEAIRNAPGREGEG